MRKTTCVFILASLLVAAPLQAQQHPDTTFTPPNNKAAYDQNGPVVYIDGGHGNFHTAENRFAPFAKLVQRDGYEISSGNGLITESLLANLKILVISNALNAKNQQLWANPILPAFSKQEITTIEKWVKGGGRLLLIADHMPFPAATADLAKAFGFEFNNGFARSDGKNNGVFTRENGLLASHSITNNSTYGPAIAKLVSFTGQGFKYPAQAQSLMHLDKNYYSLMPDTAWRFNDQTPKVNLDGWSQGAVMNYGAGKVAVFGEAAMFTAQLAGPQKRKIGFNTPAAPHNAQFALNVIHWLDDLIE